MNFESYYRKLTDKERNGKPYKYELVKPASYGPIDLGNYPVRIEYYIMYSAVYYHMVILAGYRWDGSTVVFDTKYCMRASLVHDALYQLFREGKLDMKYRKYADQIYRDIMIEDGAWKWWAGVRYTGLRIKAAWDRITKKGKGEK